MDILKKLQKRIESDQYTEEQKLVKKNKTNFQSFVPLQLVFVT
jgi:hypothetical protein